MGRDVDTCVMVKGTPDQLSEFELNLQAWVNNVSKGIGRNSRTPSSMSYGPIGIKPVLELLELPYVPGSVPFFRRLEIGDDYYISVVEIYSRADGIEFLVEQSTRLPAVLIVYDGKWDQGLYVRAVNSDMLPYLVECDAFDKDEVLQKVAADVIKKLES